MHVGFDRQKEALLNKSEVADAVTHSTLGPTTIGYGAPGSAKKDYKVGDWRSHIIVRRTLEGEDPGETLVRVIDVPRMVNQDVDMGPRDGERVDVELNGYTAVVSLYRFGNKEAWFLTGFKGLPKGYPSTHWATHPKCLVSHSEWLQPAGSGEHQTQSPDESLQPAAGLRPL